MLAAECTRQNHWHRKQRLFLKTEKEVKRKDEERLTLHRATSWDKIRELAQSGMPVEKATQNAFRNALV